MFTPSFLPGKLSEHMFQKITCIYNPQRFELNPGNHDREIAPE